MVDVRDVWGASAWHRDAAEQHAKVSSQDSSVPGRETDPSGDVASAVGPASTSTVSQVNSCLASLVEATIDPKMSE